MTQSNRRVACISGFAGVGKGTQVKRLLSEFPNYTISISMTTRAPRTNRVGDKMVPEQDGVEYFFRTDEQFERSIEQGELLEYARYGNHYYGTPRAFVEKMRAEGRDVLLEIEVQGALQVKSALPETVLIFIMTPSAEELEKRLVGRGSETYEEVTGRLERALEEIELIPKYDYVVINDDLQRCTLAIHDAIQHGRGSKADASFIEQFRQDLRKIVDRRKAEKETDQK